MKHDANQPRPFWQRLLNSWLACFLFVAAMIALYALFRFLGGRSH